MSVWEIHGLPENLIKRLFDLIGRTTLGWQFRHVQAVVFGGKGAKIVSTCVAMFRVCRPLRAILILLKRTEKAK